MQKIIFMMSLFFINGASAEIQSCTSELEGERFCNANKTMTCVKIFNPEIKAFKYEMRGVNVVGHAFITSIPWYEKTRGYSPVACEESSVAINKLRAVNKYDQFSTQK